MVGGGAELAQAANGSIGEVLLRDKRLHDKNFRWRLGKMRSDIAGPAAASQGTGGSSTATMAARPDGDEDSPANLPPPFEDPPLLPRGNFSSHRKPDNMLFIH